MFKVPILLVLYNRIEETHNVFEILGTVQPTQLYVAGDGPKPGNTLDRTHVYQTRSVIQPAWHCQLHTFWQDEHLGKSQMIYKAIQWFFEHEEEGIVLFEDTLPTYDFFPYCEELLRQYRNDERVFSIGGTYLRHRSRQRYKKRLRKGGSSYYFSSYASTWGFATWRNRWQDFSLSMAQYDSDKISEIVARNMKKPKFRSYWINRFNIIKKNNASYWDYQINLHVWAHDGVCIEPYLNLVTNIGVKNNAKRKLRRLRKNAYPIMPLTHPTEKEVNRKEDNFIFKHIYKKAYFYLFRDWLKEILPNKSE